MPPSHKLTNQGQDDRHTAFLLETLRTDHKSPFPQKAQLTFRVGNQPSAFTQVVSHSPTHSAIQVETSPVQRGVIDPSEAPIVDPNQKIRCTIKVLRNGEHKRIDVLNKTAVRALKRYYVQ